MNRRPRLWRRLAVAVSITLASAWPIPAGAQVTPAPDSFSIRTSATGVLIEVSAPAVLPLDVLSGLSYAQVGINSQPRIQSTASPLFVPLLQDVGLLGGPAGTLAIGVRLAPGLVVGLPTLIGLDPLPADPSAVPVGPLADLAAGLPLPSPPPFGCTSNLPGEPREVECGGGADEFFGFRVGAGSARTVAEGDSEDPGSLASRSDAKVIDVSPSGGQPLMPMTFEVMGATATGGITDGRVTTAASAAVHGVDIAGQLSLDSVEASYSGALGGTAETLEESLDCRLVGAELGGERIELETGSITVPGQEVDLPTAEGLAAITDAVAGGGGEVGPADIGNVVITPNPEPLVEVSPDGSSVQRRFGCLEIRYRIPASGTDVRITLGNVAVSANAFDDEPFSTTDGDGALVASGGLGSDTIAPGRSGGVGGGRAGSESALPEAPTAGSGAPTPTERPFANSVTSAGWGIDGGWLAPFALLALALPLLVKARTFTPAPRTARR